MLYLVRASPPPPLGTLVTDKHTHHMLPGADPHRRRSLWAKYSVRILPTQLRKAAAAGGAGLGGAAHT
jgi:hypothetical protein